MVSKEGYEESVAKSVRKALQSKPSIVDCLRLGIVNFSSLGRILSQELGITYGDAVVSAIKRHRHSLDEFNHDKRLRRLVAESTIELKPDVAVLTLPKEVDWRGLGEKLRIHHVVDGPNNTNIVVDERSLALGDVALPPGVEVRRGLAAITLKSLPEFVTTPGSMVYFISPISSNGINMEEVLSCYTDKIILLKLEDAHKAFSLLNELIADCRRDPARSKNL